MGRPWPPFCNSRHKGIHVMKFARSYIQYLYTMRSHPHDWERWHGEGNIGDAVQSLAVVNLYREMGIDEEQLLRINRDALNTYEGEPCLLPLQGWFGYFADIFPFPWAKGITPFFSGFHLTSSKGSRERFAAAGIPEMMRPYQPIGCRDRGTMLFLREQGLNAYLSGCLTLTFPARQTEPEDGKVFLVDVEEEVKRQIPPPVLESTDQSITHFYYFPSYPVDADAAVRFEEHAKAILRRYRDEARSVITSRIHVALPCLGMGIPVVFLDDKGGDERFDALNGLIPVYKPSEMAQVNWNPPKADVEPLKRVVKETFFACFRAALERADMAVPLMPAAHADMPDTGAYEKAAASQDSYQLLTAQRRLRFYEEQASREINDLRARLQVYEGGWATGSFSTRLKFLLKAFLAFFPQPARNRITRCWHRLRGR